MTKKGKQIMNNIEDASWNIPQMIALMECIYVQFLNGRTTFTDQTWRHIGVELFAKTKIQLSVRQLKEKACLLRTLLRKFYDLKKTGFGSDSISSTATADEGFWAFWFADNPGETSLGKERLQHYDLCTEMFPFDSDEDDESNSSDCGPIQGRVNSNFGNLSLTNNGIHSARSLAFLNKLVQRNRKRKAIRERRVDRALDAWTEVNIAKARKYSDQSTQSIDACLNALRNMEDLPERLFFRALDPLLNETRRKMFLLMRGEERRGWVESLG